MKKKSHKGLIVLLSIVGVVVLVFAVAGISYSCQSKESEKKLEEMHKDFIGVDDFKTFEWPDSELAQQIPKPKSDFGRIDQESSDYLFVYVGKTKEKDFKDYVNSCMDEGFDVDYSKSDDRFYADNVLGYHLVVEIEEGVDEVMSIRLSAPEEETDPPEEDTEKPKEEAKVTEAPKTEAPETEAPETEAPETKSEKKSGQSYSSEEFREAMDEYEALMDEYVEFMKKYQNSDDALSMMDDYTKMLKQYETAMKKLDAIDTDTLNNEDMQYYLEVTNRVNKKLLEVAS